jgi:hypothetical protein
MSRSRSPAARRANASLIWNLLSLSLRPNATPLDFARMRPSAVLDLD